MPKHKAVSEVEPTIAPAARDAFQQNGLQVLQNLRVSLAELITALGMDTSQPQEISRRLGVDKNLSWRVTRFIREEDSWAAVPQLPGTAGFGILLNSAEKAGADAESLESVRSAVEALEEFVRHHSNDRETFTMMAGAVSPRAVREQNEAHRRLAFRGQSAVWGVQVRLQFAAQLVMPSDRAGMVDIAAMTGYVDFRRLRPDVSWTMASIGGYSGDNAFGQVDSVEPLPGDGRGADGYVLDEFCSTGHPPVRTTTGPRGVKLIELAEGPIGNTGAMTCVAGWIYRRTASIYRTPEDSLGEHIIGLSTPAELTVFDLFVHDELRAVLPPRLAIYSNLPAGRTFSPAAREQGLLPVGEEITTLGARPPSFLIPEAPFYAKLVRSVMQRLGQSERDFHGFRLRLKYPPVPALAIFSYPLLEQ